MGSEGCRSMLFAGYPRHADRILGLDIRIVPVKLHERVIGRVTVIRGAITRRRVYMEGHDLFIGVFPLLRCLVSDYDAGGVDLVIGDSVGPIPRLMGGCCRHESGQSTFRL